jgi:hypothetical protein
LIIPYTVQLERLAEAILALRFGRPEGKALQGRARIPSPTRSAGEFKNLLDYTTQADSAGIFYIL